MPLGKRTLHKNWSPDILVRNIFTTGQECPDSRILKKMRKVIDRFRSEVVMANLGVGFVLGWKLKPW